METSEGKMKYKKPKLTKHSQLKNVTFSVEAPDRDAPGNVQPRGGYEKAGWWGGDE